MSSPQSPPDEYGPYGPPPITITFTAVLVVFFIVGLCSLCFCKCYTRQNQNDHSTTNPSDQSSDKPRQGLEPSTIMAFPTLVYSNVKSLRMEDFDLECAICLSEFEDDSVLRLLTVCYHVFHQECIDLWLESHMSCPVCRANLDLPVEKILEKFPDMLRDKNMPDIHEESESVFEDAVSIDIGSDDVKEDKIWRGRRPEAASNAIEHNERHPRWHSTGHSVVAKQAEGSSGCRYTLRLPENVRVKVSRGHGGRSVTFGGVSDHNQVAFGEIVGSSSRGSSS